MKDKIIKTITHPVVGIVLLALAVISGIVFVYVNNTAMDKAETISNMPIEITRDATTDEIVVEKIDVEGNLKETLKELQEEYAYMCNPQSEITDKVEQYIKVRYNYSGSLKSNKDKILNGVKDLTSEYYLENLSNAIDRDGAGNMSTSESKGSKAEILNIYQNGRELKNITAQTETVPVYAAIKINGLRTCYRFEMLKLDGKWVINNATFVASVYEGV